MRRLLVPSLLAAALGACGDGTEDGPRTALPSLEKLEPGTWNRVETGGDTLCARGSRYAFFVYPGDPDKVAVDFMGGGACWEASGLGTCAEGGPYAATVEENAPFDAPPPDAGGLLDHALGANPIEDWTHVVVSYCTGDIHWGDNDETYGEGDAAYVIHHRGAVNARAVLDWVYANFEDPGRVAVTGCSAGAYGAVLWSAHVQQHYPGVDVAQLGDSGAGVITPEFRASNFPHWKPDEAFPAFIPALDPARVDVYALELPAMYVAIGRHFPSMHLAQFDYVSDQTQQLFYLAMGGNAWQWSEMMRAHLAEIHAGTGNFSSYVAAGSDHCVTPWKRFYTVGVPGEPGVADWTRTLFDGTAPPDVACDTCTPEGAP